MTRRAERTYSPAAWLIFHQVCDFDPDEERDELIGDLVWLHADYRGQARPNLYAEVELLLYYHGMWDPKSRSAWRRLGYVVMPGTSPLDRLRRVTVGGRELEFDVYHRDQVFEEWWDTRSE